jgi:hypothetical protein
MRKEGSQTKSTERKLRYQRQMMQCQTLSLLNVCEWIVSKKEIKSTCIKNTKLMTECGTGQWGPASLGDTQEAAIVVQD